MRLVHVITGLDVGGAELMLKRLVESDPAGVEDTVVVSLTSLGLVGEALRAGGVRVHALGMRSPLDAPAALRRLVRLVREHRPEVVQTWMYHADLWGGLAGRLAGSAPVVWNIRTTDIPQGPSGLTYWLVRLCAACSHFIPARIVSCSRAASEAHRKLWYDTGRITVIPNGYDFSTLQFSSEGRTHVRRSLGIGDTATVVGIVGRWDPLKDYRTFVSAAARVAAARPEVLFLMVGRGLEESNPELRGWIEDAGLSARFRLVGQQPGVAGHLSAMDVFCLSSASEAFPNVVVEAMAVGLPCVVTRAGDAADILGDPDLVVPVGDPARLAEVLVGVCALGPAERGTIGARNAERVRREYGIDGIRRRYLEVYESVLHPGGSDGR